MQEVIQIYSSFIGPTGSEVDVQQFALGYGAYFICDKSKSATNYVENHTADTYVLDKDSKWQPTYALNPPVQDATPMTQSIIHEPK